MKLSHLLSLAHATTAQTTPPAASGTTSALALGFILLFVLAFVGLGLAFLRKKRLERLASRDRLSLDAAHATPSGDASAPAPRAEDLLAAERDSARARAAEERARRERQRLEAAADGEGATDEQLVAARAREQAARDRAGQAALRARELSAALTATREGLVGRVARALGGATSDEAAFEELEAVLFTADVGPRTAERLLAAVRKQLGARERSDVARVQAVLRAEARDILSAVSGAPLRLEGDTPRVVMILGVNGAGKTTTIGKLAHQLKASGKSVLLGAGDTFRAAAAEQLEVWATRADVPIVQSDKENADPSSVLFDAVKEAERQGVDVVLCDTAGRLHTKVNLMEELRKVTRVLAKAKDGAPHEVLLVLDATVGQNAIEQARQFGEVAPISGIVLTKLDGTAKGGVVLGIADQLQLPVRYIGVGEKISDLRPFDADDFLDALFGASAATARPAS